jgi:tRNA nucleotidyltransferase (CCA-adding enzyme)
MRPILSWDGSPLGEALRTALAPQRWPLAADLLPADTLLVGGAVRDALLGRLAERPDIDLVVSGDALALARRLAQRCGGSCVVLDRERSIARVVLAGWCFDLARRMGDGIADDLRRRDYSINAIALPLVGGGEPIDPCGGLEDLRRRRLRALGEANLLEDPLRLLRGVRLACELDFRIEPVTWRWLSTHRLRLAEVAGERVLAELERVAAATTGELGLARIVELGLLEGWQVAGEAALPQLLALGADAAAAIGLGAGEAAAALSLARLAALLEAGTLADLRASRRLQQRVARLRHWCLRLRQASIPGGKAGGGWPVGGLDSLRESERLLLQRELEEDLPALALHLDPIEARTALARWRDPADPLFHPRPPLDGRSLQQRLGVGPGPQLGGLIAHLTAERAFGRLSADPEAVLATARRWLALQDGSPP